MSLSDYNHNFSFKINSLTPSITWESRPVVAFATRRPAQPKNIWPSAAASSSRRASAATLTLSAPAEFPASIQGAALS